MNKVIAVGLSVLLCSGLASAQAPNTPPTPQKPAPTKTDEKANKDETLQNGPTGDRPWGAGVTADTQHIALKLFQEGNQQLNDGLFPAAAKKYREALQHWE